MLKILKFLSHLDIILGGMFLTFFIIDRFNPAMDFLGNDISKWLLCLLSADTIIVAVLSLVAIRAGERSVQE